MSADRKVLLCLGLAAMLTVMVGCGGAKRGAVSGQITLDGKPVDGGEIRFIPTVGIPAWAEIVRGRYATRASAGPSVGVAKVEIRWPRKTGKRFPAIPPAPPNAMIEETVEAMPARYNLHSELTATIQSGENVVNFALTTKP